MRASVRIVGMVNIVSFLFFKSPSTGFALDLADTLYLVYPPPPPPPPPLLLDLVCTPGLLVTAPAGALAATANLAIVRTLPVLFFFCVVVVVVVVVVVFPLV